MGKQKKRRKEIADIIVSKINVGGVFVTVSADDTYGWCASIVTAPGSVLPYQTFLERLLPEMRAQYELLA